MRAVIDTNVLLPGLFWRGAPYRLLEQVRAGAITLIRRSPELLAELDEVIRRPKFGAILARSGVNPEHMLDEARRLAEIVDVPPLSAPLSRDPDDDAVLALAQGSRADLVVTGDADLLTLAEHAGIPIVDAATVVARITGSAQS